VPDPYDSISPHHTWGPVQFTAAKLRRALKIPGSVLDVRTTVARSGRARAVVGVGSTGEVTVPAAQVRTALGLRSTWFRVGVLGLAKPAAPVSYGARIALTGVARAVPGAQLEQRVAPNVWQPAGALTPASNGSFSIVVKPAAGTTYRVKAGKVATAPVRVAVAPVVRMTAPAPNALQGTVAPLLPGARVQLQRQDGTAWTTVATAAVDQAGAFAASLQLVPGTYRARVLPVRGFAAGTSRVLNVVDA
jgi:stage II sporulation protein D